MKEKKNLVFGETFTFKILFEQKSMKKWQKKQTIGRGHDESDQEQMNIIVSCVEFNIRIKYFQLYNDDRLNAMGYTILLYFVNHHRNFHIVFVLFIFCIFLFIF